MTRLAPITSYQGGKQRLAPQIVNYLLQENAEYYYDLCCGSGAVSLELVNHGVDPKNLFMADSGPWGHFWFLVGKGLFPLKTLRDYINKIPKDKTQIKPFMEDLSRQKPDKDRAVVFLILQAASFGSKPIWISTDELGNERWANTSFRSYWQPTPTSNRRSPVNPMMPMPETLYKRTELICHKMKGLTGTEYQIRPKEKPFSFRNGKSIIYIDPPYKNRTSYGCSFDAVAWWENYSKTPPKNVVKCFISEGYKASNDAVLLAKSSDRKKGGISGTKKVNPNEEWLNIF